MPPFESAGVADSRPVETEKEKKREKEREKGKEAKKRAKEEAECARRRAGPGAREKKEKKEEEENRRGRRGRIRETQGRHER